MVAIFISSSCNRLSLSRLVLEIALRASASARLRAREPAALATGVRAEDGRWELEAGAEPAVSAVRADVAFDLSR